MLNKFKLFSIFILIVSILVLSLALPRFMASIYSAYPQFILERIKNENFKLAEDSYSDLYRSLNHANEWSESSLNWQLLSDLQIENYTVRQKLLTNVEKGYWLKLIEILIINGLKLSPIDPYAWYQLAIVRQAERFSNDEVLNALEMSVFTQRMAPTLMIPRISFMLPYKTVLNASMSAMLQDQIRLAWQFRRNDFVALVATHIEDKALFTAAFINDPDQELTFERLLQHYFKQNQKK